MYVECMYECLLDLIGIFFRLFQSTLQNNYNSYFMIIGFIQKSLSQCLILQPLMHSRASASRASCAHVAFKVLHFALDKNGNGTKVFFKSKVRLYRTAFFCFFGSAVVVVPVVAAVVFCPLLFIKALTCTRQSRHLQLSAHTPNISVLAGLGEIIWLAAKTL